MNQRNIVVLIAGMFLVSSGYTMVIPFLPLYLIDLGVPPEEIGIWSGLVFSICFLVAGIMSPFWGKLADSGGKKKMAIRASVLLGASYLFCGISQNEYQLFAAFCQCRSEENRSYLRICPDSTDCRRNLRSAHRRSNFTCGRNEKLFFYFCSFIMACQCSRHFLY